MKIESTATPEAARITGTLHRRPLAPLATDRDEGVARESPGKDEISDMHRRTTPEHHQGAD